ncbi:MAG: PepSY-associated TM helix domain-containing protein [Arenimonas sp.]
MTAKEHAAKKRRSYWLKTLHQWHWISSAICLVAMLGFAMTGITLNHASQVLAEPTVIAKKLVLPAQLLNSLTASATGKAPLPEDITKWVEDNSPLKVKGIPSEWSEDEVYFSLPHPGGDAWLSIDRRSGAVEYEVTDRGWVSYLNDLHKGRNSGSAWTWFIDIFAVACLVFAGTGLFLLQLHSRNRPGTWPIVALGLVIPFLLVIIFVH